MLKQLIKRPIAVTMCVLALAIIGVLSTRHLPVSLMPDIDIPQITVHASYPGASVRQVESKVTGPLRGQLAQVPGLKELSSESKMDASTVRLTFEPGADMDLLFIEVGEKIDRTMSWLPKEIERPKVMKASAMDIPAFFLDISLKDSTAGDGRFVQLSSFAQSVIRKRIEQLPQTAMVDISGMEGSEIVLTPRTDRMDALGIRPQDIEQAIKARDITLTSLSIVDGIYRYNIHFDAALLTDDDIRDIIIAHDNRLLRLGELCDVKHRPADTGGGLIRHNGQRAVTMAVVKQPQARMEDLQASIDTLMVELRAEFPDIAFDLTRDQTQLLTYSMDNLRVNFLLGALLACLVLFVFMRSVRLPLLIIVSIPLSLILTLLSFYILGISLNVISLSGLILGVGMIVDNSIIVIDNIRQRLQHETLDVAVVSGAKEVFMPMLSSVLTTCSVFIPLIFLSGTAGELFYDQAVAVTIALFSSLLVAVVVIPVYFRLFFRKAVVTEHKGIDILMPAYSACLKFTLRHARLVLISFAVAVAGSVLLFQALRKEQLPDMPHEDTMMTIDWNLGISEQENDQRVTELLATIDSTLHTSTAMVGAQAFLLSHTEDITSAEAVVYMKFGSEDLRLKAERELTETLAARYPRAGADFEAVGSLLDMVFRSGESRLTIRLQNSNGGRPSVLQARTFVDSLRKEFPSLVVQPVVADRTIEYRAHLEHMAVYGVTYDHLLQVLRERVGQRRVFSISDGAAPVPVMINDVIPDKSNVLASTVSINGTNIPLHLLVKTSEGEDFKTLHSGQSGDYYPIDLDCDDNTARKVMDWAQGFTARDNVREKPLKMQTSFTGDYFTSRQLVTELLVVLTVALALLYFILAAQFESLVQPLIILSEMVLDVALVFLVLWAMDESLNIMSMIGLVVMAGIVINDSILKVDTINRLRRSGTPTLAAIVRAGHKRLRPIIMTSLTTILAILPLLSRADMGSALQYPLSLTLVVGMIVGTMVSLFFVPLVYYIIYGRR